MKTLNAVQGGRDKIEAENEKLKEAIRGHHMLWSQGGYCFGECSILCAALSEIEGK